MVKEVVYYAGIIEEEELQAHIKTYLVGVVEDAEASNPTFESPPDFK